jgi:hypothetical protein
VKIWKKDKKIANKFMIIVYVQSKTRQTSCIEEHCKSGKCTGIE